MVASCFRGLSTRPTHSSTSQVCVIFSRRKASESEVKQGEQWGEGEERSLGPCLSSLSCFQTMYEPALWTTGSATEALWPGQLMACPAKPGTAGSPMTTSETDTLLLDLRLTSPSMQCSEILCLQVQAHTKEWPGRELLPKSRQGL